jgi:hypothetical protein
MDQPKTLAPHVDSIARVFDESWKKAGFMLFHLEPDGALYHEVGATTRTLRESHTASRIAVIRAELLRLVASSVTITIDAPVNTVGVKRTELTHYESRGSRGSTVYFQNNK